MKKNEEESFTETNGKKPLLYKLHGQLFILIIIHWIVASDVWKCALIVAARLLLIFVYLILSIGVSYHELIIQYVQPKIKCKLKIWI